MNDIAFPAARAGSDFAQLSNRITELGLLDRRPVYYVVRLTTVAVLFAAGWVVFCWIGDSWWQLTVAGFLAVIFGQIALVSHDLAHRQVFRTRRPARRKSGNPSMPSPNPRGAAPDVQKYCAEIGVPYHETSLLDACRQTLRHLHLASAPIRAGS